MYKLSRSDKKLVTFFIQWYQQKMPKWFVPP